MSSISPSPPLIAIYPRTQAADDDEEPLMTTSPNVEPVPGPPSGPPPVPTPGPPIDPPGDPQPIPDPGPIDRTT